MFNVASLKRLLLRYWPLVLILLIAGVLLLIRINKDTLWDWDECIYAEYGREMMLTGNFLTNQWNGILGFEKPPLLALMLQIPFMFGINEVTARILSVLFFLSIIGIVYVFAKKYFSERTAIMSALMILATDIFLAYGGRTNTDIPYTAFLLAALFLWIASFKKGWFSYLSGLFFALAVMTKGLSIISFLLAIFISIFLPYRKEKLVNFIKLMVVLVALIAPWHIYHFLRYGQKFTYVYVYENLIKRSNNILEFHFTGKGFYIKEFFRNLFPWILAFLALPLYYLANIKKFLAKQSLFKEIKRQEVIIVLFLTIVIPFAFLTKSQTRLPWYAIPIYPLLAIFLSYSVDFIALKLKRPLLFYAVLFFVAADAIILLLGTQQWTKAVPGYKYEAFLKASQYPQKNLNILVSFAERTTEATMPESMRTTTTFTYGGSPCAPFYSHKQITSFYSKEKFRQQVEKHQGLYIIENGDKHVVDDIPKKELYTNNEYTLFE